MAEPELVLHVGIGKSACKSCGKPIVWAWTAGGKKAPYEEDPNGEWILENGAWRHVGPPAPQLELGAAPSGPTRYTSHFARCPHASEWRGRK